MKEKQQTMPEVVGYTEEQKQAVLHDWYRELGKRPRTSTEARKIASRKNGKLGGRPRKNKA